MVKEKVLDLANKISRVKRGSKNGITADRPEYKILEPIVTEEMAEVGLCLELRKLFDLSTNVTSPDTANEKGSGLGLVLCAEFAKKLVGHIWVESEEGKGSDFKFTLPLSISK